MTSGVPSATDLNKVMAQMQANSTNNLASSTSSSLTLNQAALGGTNAAADPATAEAPPVATGKTLPANPFGLK